MKKFIVLYHAPAEATAQMATMTPEQAAEGIKPWMAWNEKCGNAMVELGAPLAASQSLDTNGNWGGSAKEVSGYSILQGESIADVKALLVGHPHLSWAPGCSIEVHECMPM